MLWKIISLHVLVFFFKEVHSEKDKNISLFSDIVVLSNTWIRIHINHPIPLLFMLMFLQNTDVLQMSKSYMTC